MSVNGQTKYSYLSIREEMAEPVQGPEKEVEKMRIPHLGASTAPEMGYLH
jgi:hypothetical protein